MYFTGNDSSRCHMSGSVIDSFICFKCGISEQPRMITFFFNRRSFSHNNSYLNHSQQAVFPSTIRTLANSTSTTSPPGTQNQFNNMINTLPVLHLSEDRRSALPSQVSATYLPTAS